MQNLLIVNDYPPIRGGQSAYYDYLSRAWPAGKLIVLAPRLPGDADMDAGRSFPVIRRRYVFKVPILEKAAKIVLPFIYAVGIIRREEIRDVHCGHVLSTGVVGLLLKMFLKKEYVVYIHSADILEYRGMPVVKHVLSAVLTHARQVVANSRFTRGHLLELGVPEGKIVIIHPRVDSERFKAAADTRVLERYGVRGKSVLLSVNRIVERKGNDKVIESLPEILRACPDTVYVIAGNGPDGGRLRTLAHDFGVADHVIFAANADSEEIVAWYQACDVFVMPSREIPDKGDAEGFGIVYLEANACGKPVVGGRSGGVADAVVDGETGLLVDPHSPTDIARAVIRLLQDPAFARQLGGQGRLRAENDFDWRRGIPELTALGVHDG